MHILNRKVGSRMLHHWMSKKLILTTLSFSDIEEITSPEVSSEKEANYVDLN
jgi:hypothetical protein